MKTFYYSSRRQEIEDKLEGHAIASARVISVLQNLSLSKGMDIDETLSGLRKLLAHRKDIAEMFSKNSDENQNEQLAEVLDCVNDDIRKIIGI